MMRLPTILASTLILAFAVSGCKSSSKDGGSSDKPTTDNGTDTGAAGADPGLADFINKIKAVDNHTHVNTINPDDEGSDALPLHILFPFEIPARLRPTSPDWVAAHKALYGFPHDQLDEAKMKEAIAGVEKVAKEQGEKFPTWVLDKVGTEVLVANRMSMGPGLTGNRFKWVSYVDMLMYPVSTEKAANNPDRQKLFPIEAKHLEKMLADLKMDKIPASLDDYLKKVVTATLEAQKKGGAIGVKFEVGFLRSLDFARPQAAAKTIYAKYAKGGAPTAAEYKVLSDAIFHHIAKEAGRLGMAVHIHSFHGPGGFYNASGSDPILLEPTFNDPELRKTNFVLIHAGGVFSASAEAMLWKPNVYADISALTRVYSADKLAGLLAKWLNQYPEKILYGSDASAFGPGLGWELGAWIAGKTARDALALALSDLVRTGAINKGQAQEIATMVMRGNASRLYELGLK